MGVGEKSQILALVKKLSESIEKQKDILGGVQAAQSVPVAKQPAPKPVDDNENAERNHESGTSSGGESSLDNVGKPASPFSVAASTAVPAPPHSLKLNNTRANQSSSFLKQKQQQQQAAAAVVAA